MDWFAAAFIRASLVWLAVGVTLAVAMGVHPAWVIYRPVHMHATLLGFVTMMIYGVGYHVLPRFAGAKLWSKRLPAVHVWFSNIGLGALAVGFVMRVSTSASQLAAGVFVGFGGTLSALGAYLFVFNLWKTLNRATDRTLVPIAKR